MKYVKKEEKNEKEKFDLQECFVLWLNTSKEGNKYLTGYDFNHNRLIGFFNKNKTKDNQPSIRLYGVDEEGKTTAEEVITLWDTKFKTSGKTGLNGYTNEKEGIIAFYGEESEKRPYIRGYFTKENK